MLTRSGYQPINVENLKYLNKLCKPGDIRIVFGWNDYTIAVCASKENEDVGWKVVEVWERRVKGGCCSEDSELPDTIDLNQYVQNEKEK